MRKVKVIIVANGKKSLVSLIPETWLVGACQIRENQGMKPMQAMQGSIASWLEQERLEAFFEAEAK